jgi:hypothetical protein
MFRRIRNPGRPGRPKAEVRRTQEASRRGVFTNPWLPLPSGTPRFRGRGPATVPADSGSSRIAPPEIVRRGFFRFRSRIPALSSWTPQNETLVGNPDGVQGPGRLHGRNGDQSEYFRMTTPRDRWPGPQFRSGDSSTDTASDASGRGSSGSARDPRCRRGRDAVNPRHAAPFRRRT